MSVTMKIKMKMSFMHCNVILYLSLHTEDIFTHLAISYIIQLSPCPVLNIIVLISHSS